MIPLLPKWNLHNSRPSFYDSDTVTMLELAAKLHGTMNSLIEDYNSLVEGVNKTIAEFKEGTIEDFEAFETAMRQEFQDFIDSVAVGYQLQEQRINTKIEEFENTVNELIGEIQGSVETLLNTDF